MPPMARARPPASKAWREAGAPERRHAPYGCGPRGLEGNFRLRRGQRRHGRELDVVAKLGEAFHETVGGLLLGGWVEGQWPAILEEGAPGEHVEDGGQHGRGDGKDG